MSWPGRLADARRRLSQLELPAAVSDRLHRQFIAICDAIKVPEADIATATAPGRRIPVHTGASGREKFEK